MGRPKGSKNKKTLEKMAKKQIKKMPIGLTITIVLVLLIGIAVIAYLNKDKILSYFNDDKPEIEVVGDVAYLVKENTIAEEVKVTFLELFGQDNNPQIGDSIFIECGDIDILIDAGEKGSGTATVVPFLEEHVEDDILELVIVTHSDSDHMGGMVGLSSKYGVLEIPGFEYLYLVDFGYEASTKLYIEYIEIRNKLINNGTVCYSPIDLFGTSPKEGCASRFYLGVDTYLDLLDYKTHSIDEIDDPNDKSVVCLLTHGENKMFFSGDAEKEEEKYLVDLGIGNVEVFKANHHGSRTSNTDALLTNLNPTYVFITSSEENQHDLPDEDIVDRFNKYTQNVYATFISGNITVISKNNQIYIESERKLDKVQESSWYLSK